MTTVPTAPHAHRIEESVAVYLQLSDDGTRWELDPATYDGSPLFSNYDMPNHYDECRIRDNETSTSTRDEGDALADKVANDVELPDADALLHLLAGVLGYTVTRTPATPEPIKLGVLVVRDPDSATEVYSCVNDKGVWDRSGVEYTEITVDPGAGWTREDWNTHRADSLTEAGLHGPEFTALVSGAFDEVDNSNYITDDEEI